MSKSTVSKKVAAKKSVVEAVVAPVVESAAKSPSKTSVKKVTKAASKAAEKATPAVDVAPVTKSSAKKASKKGAAKTETPAVEPVKVPGIHGPVRNGTEVYLHPTDLSKLEMLQLRVRNAQQTVELASAKILAFQQEAQMKIAASKEDAQKLVKEYESQRDVLVDLYKKIELAYGVDMKTFAYDSMTGRINPLPTASTPEA